MSAVQSVLDPRPQPLWGYVVLALMLHGCGVGSSALFNAVDLFDSRRPLVDVETIEVSLVQMKHTDRMPTRATVAPRPSGEPAPPSATKPAPPPPVQSDLTFRTPDAEPAPGVSARDDAIRKALMEAALADAMEGTQDREATDPNSTATESINTGGSGAMPADPEFLRYIEKVRKLFMDQFHPNPAIVAANPKLKVTWDVYFDHETGEVERHELRKGSGNASYDASAEFAIQAVRTVPLPPEKYRERVRFFTVDFTPP